MKNYLKILPIVIIICTIIFGVIYHKQKLVTEQWKELFFECQNDQIIKDYSLNREKEYKNLIRKIEGTKLINIMVIDGSRNEFMIADLINKEKVVFWFDYAQSCQECVNKVVGYLHSLSGEIGKSNILIITNYPQIMDIKIIEQKLGYSLNYYNCRTKWLGDLENQHSFNKQLLFTVSPDLKVKFPFIPDSKDSLDSDKFQKLLSDFI